MRTVSVIGYGHIGSALVAGIADVQGWQLGRVLTRRPVPGLSTQTQDPGAFLAHPSDLIIEMLANVNLATDLDQLIIRHQLHRARNHVAGQAGHGLLDCFSFVTGTSRIFGKDRRIRKAIRDAGLDSNEVLYVGDEIRDIEAGRAAQVEVAVVT